MKLGEKVLKKLKKEVEEKGLKLAITEGNKEGKRHTRQREPDRIEDCTQTIS